jgi:hypothetical protein
MKLPLLATVLLACAALAPAAHAQPGPGGGPHGEPMKERWLRERPDRAPDWQEHRVRMRERQEHRERMREWREERMRERSLTPEERRALRRDIDQVGREIYHR